MLFVSGEMEMEKIQGDVGFKSSSRNPFLQSDIVHVGNSQTWEPVRL